MSKGIDDSSQEFVFVGKREAAKLIGYAPDTLKKLRKAGLLQEGIHWISVNSRTVRYNKGLLWDWMMNRDDPQAHQRTIDRFSQSLPSNQRAVRRSERVGKA